MPRRMPAAVIIGAISSPAYDRLRGVVSTTIHATGTADGRTPFRRAVFFDDVLYIVGAERCRPRPSPPQAAAADRTAPLLQLAR